MSDAVEQGSGDDGCGEADETGAEACGAIFRCVANAKNSRDASGERAAVCGEAEGRRGAPFLHGGEGARVAEVIAAGGDSNVVAAVFTFDAHALVQPPNRRMEKEKRFHDDLEKINEGIEAANVREFVRDDGFDLIFGEAGERSNGKKYDGTEPADDCRRVQPATFAETNCARDAEARLEFAALCEERGRDGERGGAAEALEIDEAAGGAQREEEHTGEPEFDEQGKRLSGQRFDGRSAGERGLDGLREKGFLCEDNERSRGAFGGLHRGLRVEKDDEGAGHGSDHGEEGQHADDIARGSAAEER